MSNSPQSKSPDSKQPTTETISAAKNTTPETNTQTTPAPTTASGSATKTGTEATPDVKFTTDKIGQWKSQQENPFAEQNRRTATKKAQREATVRKVFPIGLIAGISLLSAALIFCVVMLIVSIVKNQPTLPEDEIPVFAGDSATGIGDYEKILNKFYNQRPDASENERLQAVQNAVNSTLKTDNGREYENQVLTAQAFFYFNNSLYEQALEVGREVDDSQLNNDNKLLYYSIMYYCYARMGDTEMSQEYFGKAYMINNEMSGND